MTLVYNRKQIYEKANIYCEMHGISITQELGHGTQGVVYQTRTNTAIKVYDLSSGYFRERDIYMRLRERLIDSVRKFKIPRILNWNNELLVLEMSIVHVPCMLDFGGAYLDDCPEHLLIRDEEWEIDKKEEFGEHWEEAKAIIREVEVRADIWLADINTGNIKFEGF